MTQRNPVTPVPGPRVLINGLSARSGGGQSVLRNLLAAFSAHNGAHHFVVLVPEDNVENYRDLEVPRIEIVPLARRFGFLSLVWQTLVSIPRIMRDRKCDILLNLSDIPVRTGQRQIFLFDWSYAAFPDSPAWRRMSLKDWAIRSAKLAIFRLNLKHIDTFCSADVSHERANGLFIQHQKHFYRSKRC